MTHESFTRHDSDAPGGERPFGMVMAAAFAVLALLNYWHEGRIWPWLGAIAVAFLVAAYLWPSVLRPLNWIWFKFGMLLHAVVNPIVMGVVFFCAVWPTAMVMRLLRKDLLRLRTEPGRDSYWIVRQPPGP